MANSSALILRDSRDGEEPALPVALRSNGQLEVTMLDVVGPGRLLHQAYSIVGRGVEKALGQVADKLGLGPAPTSCNIENIFGSDAITRQSVLDNIHDSFLNTTSTQNERVLCALKKDCKKLLEYALPTESPTTRVQTFRNIILLTTRYPGLRRIFLQSPAINKAADSPDAICRLWQITESISDREVCFMLEFAAHCLAKCNLNIYLEGIRPTKLGRSFEGGMGVVDRMLVRYCDGVSGFPRLIAIRYLAGILELPGFWLENYHVQKATMDKLCKQTLRLIEDINPDSVSAEDFGRLALLDPDGVDALADAILVGGGQWIQREPRVNGSDSDCWLINFIKLIKMLRGLILPELLPSAFRRATGNWEACLKGTIDQLPMSSLDYQYEDVVEFVNGPVDSQSAMPFGSNWRPPDVAEESLKGKAEGSSSLLKTFTATMRATFRGRTASNIEGPLTDKAPQENYCGPETREGGGTLTRETNLPEILDDTDSTASTNSHTSHPRLEDPLPVDMEYDSDSPLPPGLISQTITDSGGVTPTWQADTLPPEDLPWPVHRWTTRSVRSTTSSLNSSRPNTPPPGVSVVLHSALVAGPVHFNYDLSLPPVPGVALNHPTYDVSTFWDRAVTDAPASFMEIECALLPWKIAVSPSRNSPYHYITFGDLFVCLYNNLRTQVKQAEYDQVTSIRYQTQIDDAYKRRSKRLANYDHYEKELQGGVRRVDFLGEYVQFAGLSPNPNFRTWTLLVMATPALSLS